MAALIGDTLATLIICGCPIAAMIYGAIVIGDDDFVSDYSDVERNF